MIIAFYVFNAILKVRTFTLRLNNPLINLFLGSIIFIVLLYGIKYSLNFFKPVKGGGVETVTEIMAGDKWKKN